MGKKIVILLVVIGALAGWFYFSNLQKDAASSLASSSNAADGANKSVTSPTGRDGDPHEKLDAIKKAAGNTADEEEDEVLEEDISAAEKYKSAEEALEAVKKASVDYDDVVLDYFVEPGADCTWCPKFYEGVRKLLTDPGIDSDQRGYYAEILAISNNMDNIQTLVESIKNSPNQDSKEAIAEALELTVGDDKVTEYLAGYLGDSDQTLKEASVAALSNQGSRLAAEVLYKNAVETKNSNGYYDLGIGLGELVPDEDALPFLHEQAQKRDDYSHLAVKALLNSGAPGLSILVDIMNQSTNSASDESLLKDAEDHVIYDKDVKAILQKVVDSNKNPRFQEFAKRVLKDFSEEDLEELDTDDANG